MWYMHCLLTIKSIRVYTLAEPIQFIAKIQLFKNQINFIKPAWNKARKKIASSTSQPFEVATGLRQS